MDEDTRERVGAEPRHGFFSDGTEDRIG